MDLHDIHAAVGALRGRAKFFTTKRRKDIELYRLIADCMALCERCQLEGAVDQVRTAYMQAVKADGKRTYFENSADVYRVIGRAVFDPDGVVGAQGGYFRYIAAMREAAKRQIKAADLADFMAGNGGVNALFKSRPTTARSYTTKTLHLLEAVTIPKDAAVTLTLRRADNGFFHVVSAGAGG